ncbi:hypothetical protein [Nocardia carnea]|uniref:hypothetical protein n=1 Tax=Nocardia carnea TaxID=37328 RepID=UPI0024537B0F|nr:hypothetical protein [Nocardia carnea]
MTMTFTPVLHSEWIKARSLPSLNGILVLLLAVTVGLSLLGSATLAHEAKGTADFDPVLLSFFGINFGQVIAIAFGAACAAGSYRDNGMRVWLTAVPRRGLLYSANLTVIGALTFGVGLVTGVICFLVGRPLIGDGAIGLDDPVGWRAMLGCAVHLTLMALMAAGIATLLRSSAATMGALIPLVLMLSFMLGDVTHGGSVAEFLPDRAGRQALVYDPTGVLGPWTGLAVTACWAAAAIGVGWTALHRRDS